MLVSVICQPTATALVQHESAIFTCLPPTRGLAREDATTCPAHHAAAGSAGRGYQPHALPSPGHHLTTDTWDLRRQARVPAGPCQNGRPTADSSAVYRKPMPRITPTGVGWLLPTAQQNIRPYECHNPVTGFPAPFWPRKPVTMPGRMGKDRSLTAMVEPYRLTRP